MFLSKKCTNTSCKPAPENDDTVTVAWDRHGIWLLYKCDCQNVWTCLDNFSNVNYVVYSPRTMKVRNITEKKEILSNNEGNVKTACAWMTQYVCRSLSALTKSVTSRIVAPLLFRTAISRLHNSKCVIKEKHLLIFLPLCVFFCLNFPS